MIQISDDILFKMLLILLYSIITLSEVGFSKKTLQFLYPGTGCSLNGIQCCNFNDFVKNVHKFYFNKINLLLICCTLGREMKKH